MAGLSTADCRNWLATDPAIQKLVKDRVGYDPNPAVFLEVCDNDPQEVAFFTKWVTDAAIPKKWKRMSKFKIGGKHDQENSGYGESTFIRQQLGFDPAGGVAREFMLEGTDRISAVIVEHHGKLYLLEETCD